MRDMYTGEKHPDDKVIFDDGILYIICQQEDEEGIPHEIFGETLFLDAEYDAPISLADIKEKYPKVRKVVFEKPLHGEEYTYGNHKGEKNTEIWEKTGENKGYA